MKSYRKVLLVVLSITVSGCAYLGDQNSTMVTKPAKRPMAIGDISPQQLLSNYPAFNEEFKAFSLSNEETELVRAWPVNLRVDAYFGTWCHDSVREVPRLLKALSTQVDINLIGLDYSKSEPLGRELQVNIKFTPTFVVYLNNAVIGRIVEQPKVSLVLDIDDLIKKEAG